MADLIAILIPFGLGLFWFGMGETEISTCWLLIAIFIKIRIKL